MKKDHEFAKGLVCLGVCFCLFVPSTIRYWSFTLFISYFLFSFYLSIFFVDYLTMLSVTHTIERRGWIKIFRIWEGSATDLA